MSVGSSPSASPVETQRHQRLRAVRQMSVALSYDLGYLGFGEIHAIFLTVVYCLCAQVHFSVCAVSEDEETPLQVHENSSGALAVFFSLSFDLLL